MMHTVSVSKLAVACVHDGYRDLLSKAPTSAPPFLAAFTTVAGNAAPGVVFHEIAAAFTHLLASGDDVAPPCGSGVQALWDCLYKEIAKDHLFRIAASNPQAASNLSAALRQFCANLNQLGHECPAPAAWNRIFIASEFALESVPLQTSKGAIHVSGRIDTLRFTSSGLKVVDYKLSQGMYRDRDQVQLALYAKLLEASRHAVRADGILEYYHPELFVTEIPHAELDRIYVGQVVPILESLLNAWETAEPGGDTASRPRSAPSGPVTVTVDQMILSFPDDIRLPAATLRTHTAVVGAAGSGKTWMAKILAEEAILARTPVIAIDPQGDIVQMIKRRDQKEIPALECRERYDRFWNFVEPRIYTPGTTHGIRLSLEPIRLIRPQDILSAIDEGRRQEEVNAILTETANAVVGLASVTAREHANHEALTYSILRHLVSIDRVSLTLRDLAGMIREPDSISFPEDPEMILSKANRERFARSLYALATGPSATLFEGGQPLDIARLVRPDAEGRIPFNIVYLNALTDDQKTQFVGCLSTAIYRWMITALDSSSQSNNLLFYLDEARDYLPAGAKSTACKQPLIRLFTQGRKYGVGCLVCTQSPRSVDYNVFGNCSTKFIGRLEAAQDVDRVAEWFQSDGGRPDWLPGRVGAEKGSFVGRWPGQAPQYKGRAFRTRMLYTSHADAWAPHRVESEWRAFSSQRSGPR